MENIILYYKTSSTRWTIEIYRKNVYKRESVAGVIVRTCYSFLHTTTPPERPGRVVAWYDISLSHTAATLPGRSGRVVSCGTLRLPCPVGPAGYRLGLLPGRVVTCGKTRQGSDVARISATLPGRSGRVPPYRITRLPCPAG